MKSSLKSLPLGIRSIIEQERDAWHMAYPRSIETYTVRTPHTTASGRLLARRATADAGELRTELARRTVRALAASAGPHRGGARRAHRLLVCRGHDLVGQVQPEDVRIEGRQRVHTYNGRWREQKDVSNTP
jgi:hypothetical protein